MQFLQDGFLSDGGEECVGEMQAHNLDDETALKWRNESHRVS